jgi:hypothetical protein
MPGVSLAGQIGLLEPGLPYSPSSGMIARFASLVPGANPQDLGAIVGKRSLAAGGKRNAFQGTNSSRDQATRNRRRVEGSLGHHQSGPHAVDGFTSLHSVIVVVAAGSHVRRG